MNSLLLHRHPEIALLHQQNQPFDHHHRLAKEFFEVLPETLPIQL